MTPVDPLDEAELVVLALAVPEVERLELASVPPEEPAWVVAPEPLLVATDPLAPVAPWLPLEPVTAADDPVGPLPAAAAELVLEPVGLELPHADETTTAPSASQ